MQNKDRMTDHQHVQTSQIIAEQYLWDQSDKHRMTDPAEDTLKQFGNQKQQNKTYIHNEQLNNVPTGNSACDTQQESTQHNTRNNDKKER